MTKKNDTSITEINITSTADVTSENDAYNIEDTRVLEGYTFGAVSWTVAEKSVSSSRATVLRLIVTRIKRELPDYGTWLLIGHSAWQPNTRIVKYRKIWSALKARGVEIQYAEDSYEEMVEVDGKLKFFGAKKISKLSVESVVNAISEEHCAYVLAVPNVTEPVDILKKGWSPGSSFDKGLLKFGVENLGIVLKVIGEFDDPETGFVAVGSPELVLLLGNT